MTDIALKNISALCKKSYEIKFDLEGSKYEPIENIGSGAYGVVCSAVNKKNKEKVAIKKIPSIFDQPTIAKRTYREIKILKHFKHDNIIAIREILQPKTGQEELKDIYIVLDLMESDLHRIIHSKQNLSNEHVKYFLYQLLRGLKYIHSANVIHRDLKPSNLLVNANCELKIGDFGMSRGVSSEVDTNNAFMTLYVATRWYRAPELMMSFVQYTLSVDIWSVGCIFAEMLGRKQIFPGKDAIHQMALIFSILGTPKADVFKTKSEILHGLIRRMGCRIPVPLEKQYPHADKKAIDLLSKMLQLDPSKRISAEEALKHPYLNKYHDETDEPICIPAFDFGFEKEDLSLGRVKEAIIQEVNEYKKPGIRGKKTVIPNTNIPGNFTTVIPGNLVKVKNVEGSFKNIPGTFSSSLPGRFTKVQKSVKSTEGKIEKIPGTFSSSIPGTFTKVKSKEKTVTFKKPIPTALTMTKKEKNENTENENSENDVEMLSARNEEKEIFKKPSILKPGSCQTKIQVSIDEDMPSAKREETEKNKELQKSLDTKALLKAVILRSGLKKKVKENPENSIQRPVTALQRQKEREEKRRKKLEKAKLKKKKEKKKETKVIELSEEDKSLLEKWSSMQQKSKSVCDHKNKKQKMSPHKESGNVLQTVSANTQSNTPSNTQSNTQSNTLSNGNKNYLQKSTDSVLQTTSVKPEGLQPCQFTTSMISDNLQTNQTSTLTGEGLQIKQTFTLTVEATQPVITNPDEPLNLVKNETNLTRTVLTNSSDSLNLTRTGSDDDLQTLNGPIIILDTSSEGTVEISTRLPTYSEFLEAKNQYMQPKQVDTTQLPKQADMTQLPKQVDMTQLPKQVDITQLPKQADMTQLPKQVDMTQLPKQADTTQLPNDFVSEDLPSTSVYFDTNSRFGQNYSTSNEDSLSPIQLPFLSPSSDSTPHIAFSPSDLAMGNVDKGHDLLSVVTKQMSRSHVDDLTLAHTPMGTGDGYGVGMDLDVLLDEDMLPHRGPESAAPISAGLYQDWLDLVNIDPSEMNDMVQEIGMTSPFVF